LSLLGKAFQITELIKTLQSVVAVEVSVAHTWFGHMQTAYFVL
jgi:hypothetical protein